MWATNPQRHLREEAAAGKEACSKERKDYPASQRAPSLLSMELLGPSAVIGWPAAPACRSLTTHPGRTTSVCFAEETEFL